jgi:hypothetical protein
MILKDIGYSKKSDHVYLMPADIPGPAIPPAVSITPPYQYIHAQLAYIISINPPHQLISLYLYMYIYSPYQHLLASSSRVISSIFLYNKPFGYPSCACPTCRISLPGYRSIGINTVYAASITEHFLSHNTLRHMYLVF